MTIKRSYILLILLALFVPEDGWTAKHSKRGPKANALPIPEEFSVSLNYFRPARLLEGIGLGRIGMSDEVLRLRTERIIRSSTFSIMCDPRAVDGAQRILSPELQHYFGAASEKTGFPQDMLEAVALVESWGVADAKSPSGALGIMQFISTTAKLLGLGVPSKTFISKKISRKKASVPLGVDERLSAEKSILAAARHLESLSRRYGRIDLAIWAYHSGPGYPDKALEIAKKYGMLNPSMGRLFFDNSPAHHQELYELIQKDMRHDFGSTYYFTVKRAAELLNIYRREPGVYRALAKEYSNPLHPNQRTPNRLWFWYGAAPMFKTAEDLKLEQGRSLVSVPFSPAGLSFSLRKEAIGQKDPKNRELYLQDTPEVIGALEYIAFEHRRLCEAVRPKKEKYVPIDVVGLIQTLAYRNLLKEVPTRHTELPVHCIGAVDISYQKLPSWEAKCLEFLVEDLGLDEYISYFLGPKSKKTLTFGVSPNYSSYFTKVSTEAQEFLGSR